MFDGNKFYFSLLNYADIVEFKVLKLKTIAGKESNFFQLIKV